jgi:SHS2 domain-containing protein
MAGARVEHFEHYEHGADIGVRGIGATIAGSAFEQAALALTAVVTEPGRGAARTTIDIRCEAPTESCCSPSGSTRIVFEMADRRMLFSRFEIAYRKRLGLEAHRSASRPRCRAPPARGRGMRVPA